MVYYRIRARPGEPLASATAESLVGSPSEIHAMRKRPIRRQWLACALVALLGCAGSDKSTIVPPQTVEMDAHTLKKFQSEVEEYVELRKKVLGKIPAVSDQSTPEELAAHQQAFTAAIVKYRKGKKQGNFFKPAVEAAMRRTLTAEFTGPNGPALMKSIQQGNPKVEGNPTAKNPTKEVKASVDVAVNAVYNDAAPFSSVPSAILLKLPPLPEAVRYRFVGRTLILRDTEANVILDFLPDVVPDHSIPK